MQTQTLSSQISGEVPAVTNTAPNASEVNSSPIYAHQPPSAYKQETLDQSPPESSKIIDLKRGATNDSNGTVSDHDEDEDMGHEGLMKALGEDQKDVDMAEDDKDIEQKSSSSEEQKVKPHSHLSGADDHHVKPFKKQLTSTERAMLAHIAQQNRAAAKREARLNDTI